MLFDIDGFKHLNEVHGHAAGDTALRLVSGVARSMLRGRDLVGRLGGDQFIALLPDTTTQDALHVASRMARLVHDKQLERGSSRDAVGLSVGIIQVQEQETMDHAIHRATEAVAEAKRRGAHRAVVASVDAQGTPSFTTVQPFKPARS
jgi:diguanylate cyclase (GGDEF)-like protein